MGCKCSKELPSEHIADEQRLSAYIELPFGRNSTSSIIEQTILYNLLNQYDIKDSQSEVEPTMEKVPPKGESAVVVDENENVNGSVAIEESATKESEAVEEERRTIMVDDSSSSENESERLDSEDETTDILRETSTLYKTYEEKNSILMDPPVTGDETTDQSFADSFCCLPQEEKVSIMNSFMKEFESLSQGMDSNSCASVLYKLCLITLNERDPFILRQFYLSMLQFNTVPSLLITLYRYRADSSYPSLVSHLLIYYFVNSDHCDVDTDQLIDEGGVSILIATLQYYSQNGEIIHTSISELLSLVYILCQHGSFAEKFVEKGGLFVIHAFLRYFVSLRLSLYLDPKRKSKKEGDHSMSNKVTTRSPKTLSAVSVNVKKILYYIFSILASFGEKEVLCQRVSRVNLVGCSIIILHSLIDIITTHLLNTNQSKPLPQDNEGQNNPVENDSACNSLDNKLTNESAMTLTPSEYENEHQQKLSFSKENSKALSDDESDYALCSDVIQNVYSIIHTVLVFFKVGMRDRFFQLTFTENGGLDTLHSLFTLPRDTILYSTCEQTISIIKSLITLNFINNNVLSKYKVDDLLIVLFSLVSDRLPFIQDITMGGEVVDKKDLLMEMLTLLTYQCKSSCLSRDAIRTDTIITSLNGVIQRYDKEIIPSVIECLLSLVDLNEENLRQVATSNLLEELFPFFFDFVDNEGISVKISMFLAIFSNYYGFDVFFCSSNVIQLVKMLVMEYKSNVVIMQNCLLSLYYFSHLPIIHTMDEEMILVLQQLVESNPHDQGLHQRFARICEKMSL